MLLVGGDSTRAAGPGVSRCRRQPEPDPAVPGAGAAGGSADPRGEAAHTATHARAPAAPHSLVEGLVFYPTLPEVFAGFGRWGKIRKNNFLFLKEKETESAGEQARGAQRAGGWERGRSGRRWRAVLARGRSSSRAAPDTGDVGASADTPARHLAGGMGSRVRW